MKKVLFIIFIITLSFYIASYAEDGTEEKTVFEAVYVDDEGGEDHFLDLVDALNHVIENGTVYIGKDIGIDKAIDVHTSVSIKSYNAKKYKMSFTSGKLFDLKNISEFHLEGICFFSEKISNTDSKGVIEGHADKIYITNNEFEQCGPLKLRRGSKHTVYIEDNIFINTKTEIRPPCGENKIYLNGNQFILRSTKEEAKYEYVTFENMDVYASKNIFDKHSLMLEKGEGIKAEIMDNVFSGNQGSITVKSEGSNMHFNRNKILKNFKYAVQYTGSGKIDFRENWWGSKNEPIFMNKEKIDYAHWALDEDFNRFEGDGYTYDDLLQGLQKIGQEADDENAMYNIKKDEIIDLLDIIGMIRKIE